MTTPQAPSPATPLLASVLEELGLQIISGEFPEGKTFTLQDIGDRFDISRTVAREAMRALEQLGLVMSSRRVGITVLGSERWSVFDPTVITWRLQTESERADQLRSLTELRIAVEPIASFNAALNATEEQRAEIRELSDMLLELAGNFNGASKEFLDADTRFHQLILEASGNEMFHALSAPMMTALIGRTEHGLQPQEPAAEAMEAHAELTEAIALGEPEKAEAASRKILAEVRSALKPLK